MLLGAALLAAPCSAWPWPEPPPLADLDDSQLAALREGQILVQNDLMEETGGAALVQAIFWSPPPETWETLGNCEANFKFVDGLKECEILESTATTALTRQVVKKHFLTPRMEYSFETAREPGEWVAIRLVEGDLDIMQGSWRFESLGDGSKLVTHRIRVKPSMPVPRWLVRRTLRKDIGDMVACLRGVEHTLRADHELVYYQYTSVLEGGERPGHLVRES